MVESSSHAILQITLNKQNLTKYQLFNFKLHKPVSNIRSFRSFALSSKSLVALIFKKLEFTSGVVLSWETVLDDLLLGGFDSFEPGDLVWTGEADFGLALLGPAGFGLSLFDPSGFVLDLVLPLVIGGVDLLFDASFKPDLSFNYPICQNEYAID